MVCMWVYMTYGDWLKCYFALHPWEVVHCICAWWKMIECRNFSQRWWDNANIDTAWPCWVTTQSLNCSLCLQVVFDLCWTVKCNQCQTVSNRTKWSLWIYLDCLHVGARKQYRLSALYINNFALIFVHTYFSVWSRKV